jgi:hypothetical protein
LSRSPSDICRHPEAHEASIPAFVQGGANEVASGTTNSRSFDSADTSGNMIVVYAIWSSTGAASVADRADNRYRVATAQTTWSGN